MVTERELTQKQYLRSLESHTPEQIAEDEVLYLELKRLEQTKRQFKKDRDDLLRSLLSIESGLSDIQLGNDSSLHDLSSMPEIKSMKRTESAIEADSPSVATPSSSILHSQKRIPPIKNAAYGMSVSSLTDRPRRSYCRRRATLYNAYPSSSSCGDEIISPNGRPRSYKLPTPKQATTAKVSQTLLEYGINNSGLVMPARENILYLESLIDTTLLLETKKNVNRVERDIRVMEARILMRDGKLGGGDGGEASIDVDKEALVDDNEAGIRPGRGARKKNVGSSMQKD